MSEAVAIGRGGEATCGGRADDDYAAALASLGIAPGTLRRVVADRTPRDAWEALVAGRHPADPKRRAQRRATAQALGAASRALRASGAAVLRLGHPGYPAWLGADPEAPAILFSVGAPSFFVDRPRVAVVGTRSASSYGMGVAAELGEALASAGVVVVSGLASGIDAAAQRGALRAGGADGALAPVAVLGGAPDSRLSPPQEHLRDAVAASGCLISEVAPGGACARWSFVLRNRLLAALAHVVVVVECHARGGALETVEAARDRDVAVMAVPGSVRSPASAGTNALLAEDAYVARDVNDVLTCIERRIVGDPSVRFPAAPASSGNRRHRRVAPPSRLAAAVLRALDHHPTSLEHLVERAGLAIAELALGLEQLRDVGLAQEEAGWWVLTPN